MIYENPLAEILSVHKFKVNRATAEMLCYTFNKEVKCDRKINIKLFDRFAKYNPKYIFGYGGLSNAGVKDQPIKLNGVEIIVPPGEEEKFMDENSNFIFYGGSDCGLQWLDSEDEFDGVYGTCMINF